MNMSINKRNRNTYKEEILREHYEQFYPNNLENLYKMDFFSNILKRNTNFSRFLEMTII